MACLFRQAKMTPTPSLRVKVLPEGLTATSATMAALTAWEGIDRIVVTDQHAFFYLNEVAVYCILPRRAFADESEFETFVASARTYHDAAKLRSTAKPL